MNNDLSATSSLNPWALATLLLLSVLLSSLSDSKNQPTRRFSVPAMTVAAPAARIRRTMSSCAACSVAASARVSE